MFMSDGKMKHEIVEVDCCGVSSNVAVVPEYCGEDGAELEGQSLEIQRELRVELLLLRMKEKKRAS